MALTIYLRSNHKKNFTIISNHVLNDPNLTVSAKGLFMLIISKPNDWVIRKNKLQEESNIGRAAFNTAWKELIQQGYIVEEKCEVKGKFTGLNITVFENPSADNNDVEQTKSNQKYKFQKTDTEKSAIDNTSKVQVVTTNVCTKTDVAFSPMRKPKEPKPIVEKSLSGNIEETLRIAVNSLTSESQHVLTINKLSTEKQRTNILTDGELDSFVINKLQEFFSGRNCFDQNFYSILSAKIKKQNWDELKLNSYLDFVYKKTIENKPKKSFIGLFRTLALADSVINDFEQVQKIEKSKLRLINC